MTLEEGAARTANRTYRLHPHTGDTWHDVLPGEEGTEDILALPECVRHGDNRSALAKVAEEWVRQAGGVGVGGRTGTEWRVGVI